MNKFLDDTLKRTLWLWLPFAALYKLTKDLIYKAEGKKEKPPSRKEIEEETIV